MLTKRSLQSLLATSLVVAALLLSACGASSTTPKSSGPKFGGSIVDALYEEPDSLLPELSVETFADLVDATIWAPLYYGDNTGIIQPGLATPVPTAANGGISSDIKTYTIHLRPNLEWSDGTPLTSADVAFTLNLFKNSNYGAKTQASEFANIASIDTPDPQTVVVHLTKPDVAFLALALTDPLPGAPLPKEIYGSMDPASIAKSTNNFMPTVSSGPFVISDRVKSDHITVKRNPHYWQAPKPYLDQITFKIITDQNTILTNLQSGTIDTSWFLTITNLDALKAISGYDVVYDKVPSTFEAIYFNFTNPFLADPTVRKAITMGINTQTLITNVWKGIAQPTCDDGAGTFGHDPSLIPCYTYNPSGATTLLEGDGFTMGSDGYLHKGGKTLELRYSTTSDSAYRQQSELIVQDELKQVGIKIDIVNYPADTYFGTTLYNYGSYDIAEFANSLTYDPDNHTQWGCDQFTTAGGFNISHWCNQDAQTQITKELTDPSQADRTAAFHQLYRDILQDNPAMFYYVFPNIAIHRANLQNYAPSALGPSETWNVWDWYLS
jgi:peptide/nickel transport system substrate-binding protein